MNIFDSLFLAGIACGVLALYIALRHLESNKPAKKPTHDIYDVSDMD